MLDEIFWKFFRNTDFMVRKIIYFVATGMVLTGPLSAQKGEEDVAKLRADHERLIDLVLRLEKDFGETLRDYAKLQDDFAKQLQRPSVPDHSGKVKELQKQLQVAKAQLKQASDRNGGVDELVIGDLKALRGELHRERAALLVAKAQLAQFQRLQGRTAELEKLLEKEESRGAETMAQLQVVRGERDALKMRLTEMVRKSEKLEQEKAVAMKKIRDLQKETDSLKGMIVKKDDEIKELKASPKPDKAMMAMVDGLKKEGARLTGLLAEREKELATAKTELAAAKKLSLDVPILLKARKDLEIKLAASEKKAASAEELEKENKALMAKYQKLAGEFQEMQGVIGAMEAELVKNQEKMAAALKEGMKVKDLEIERLELKQNLAKAVDGKAVVEQELKVTMAKLQESEKTLKLVEGEFQKSQDKLNEAALEMKKLSEAAALAAKLEKEYRDLQTKAVALEKAKGSLEENLAKREDDLKSLLEEMKAKPGQAEKLAKLEAEKKKLASEHAAGILARRKLEKDLNEASMQLRRAKEAVVMADKIKADYVALTARTDELDKERAALMVELATKDGELNALKAELAQMAEKPDDSKAVAKLVEEKKQLAVKLAEREADLKKARMDLGRLHLNSAAIEKQLVALKRSTAQIDSVRYEKGAVDVKEQQARVLEQVRGVLKTFPHARFEIVGHTCDLGSKQGNLTLSRQRARSLHDFLLANGVPDERLKSRGVADAEPLVPNTNEANRRKNRRVEIEILD